MAISKTLELEKYDFYLTHLDIINTFLPIKLSQKEIEVLAGFLLVEESTSDIFSTSNRELVRELADIKSPGGLGNHLRELKRKGFIVTKDSKDIIIPIVKTQSKGEQEYRFKIKMK